MDVSFVEVESFYPDSNSSFQGETQTKRANWWEFSSSILSGGGGGLEAVDRQLGGVEEASSNTGQLRQVQESTKMGVMVPEEAIQEEGMTGQVVPNIEQALTRVGNSYKSKIMKNSFPLLQYPTQLLRIFLR